MAAVPQKAELDRIIEGLLPVDEDRPCSHGAALPLAFAEERPDDFAYLQPVDLVDLGNSAFDGIARWDAFADHIGECELCNA